jgi:short subunit dehydrogenase-like uncharacterized protein
LVEVDYDTCSLREKKFPQILMREFDLIVFGATGFTGKLVARYLCKHKESFRWAIAGRSEAKLAAVKEELGLDENVALVVADSSDKSKLNAMTSRTRVVLTTVGPYALYGTPLVEACVDSGTHCVDLTGESTWIRKLVDQFDERARQSNTFIVNCCGFDSVPADMGSLLLANAARERSATLRDVHAICTTNGGASGGTVASLLAMIEGSSAAELREVRAAYSLNGDDAWRRRVPSDAERDQLFLRKRGSRWTVPFVMAAVNTRVVRRSAELRADFYGADFTYNESMAAPGLVSALFLWAFMAIGMLMLAVPFTRSLLRRYALPAPGQGPSEAKRARSFFRYDLHATLDDGSTLDARVSGGDPGYSVTAALISEAALTLALDSDSLDTTLPGGVATPASALGNVYLDRLQRCNDVQIELID